MKYKVKELEVDAYQALKDGSIDPPEWIITAYNNHVLYFSEDDDRMFLKGRDSDTEVHDTDYIIQGAKSGLYGSESVNIFVMTADEFNDNYEPAPQNHIERMEVEASELQAKIDGAQKFLDTFQEEDAPLICDEQFDLIEKQLKFMKAYLITLRRRIDFDKEMFNAIGVKDDE